MLPARGMGPHTMTPILKESCKRIIGTLSKMPDAFIFSAPVDPVADGVPDYFDVIKTPMDLSTVFSRLNSNAYKTAEEFIADVRLIFSNCKTYNSHPDSAPVRDMADRVSVRFERFVSEFYSNPGKLGADARESAATIAARKKAEGRAAPPKPAAPKVAPKRAAAAAADGGGAASSEGEGGGGDSGGSDGEGGAGASSSPGKKLAGTKRARSAKGGANAIYLQYPPGTPAYNFWFGVEACWDDLGYYGPSRRVPVIGSKKVDLFELFDAVYNKAGGYDVVTGFKLGWTCILRDLPSLSGTTQENNGSRLKKGYERCLLEYERRIAAGWDPQNAVGEEVPVYTASMTGYPAAGCGITHEVAEKLGKERIDAFATRVGQNATILPPGVAVKVCEPMMRGGRGKGGGGGDGEEDGGEGGEGVSGEGGEGGEGGAATASSAAGERSGTGGGSSAPNRPTRGFAVTGMTAAMQAWGNGPIRLRARDGSFAAAGVQMPQLPYTWMPPGLAKDLSLTTLLPLTAQGYPPAAADAAPLPSPAAWAMARRTRTDVCATGYGLPPIVDTKGTPAVLPFQAGVAERAVPANHSQTCSKCHRRRAVLSALRVPAATGEAATASAESGAAAASAPSPAALALPPTPRSEGAGGDAPSTPAAASAAAAAGMVIANSFEALKAAYPAVATVPQTPLDIVSALPPEAVVWATPKEKESKDGAPPPPPPPPPIPMAFATCNTCANTLCYDCLFPVPESLGLAPGDHAGREVYIRNATQRALAFGSGTMRGVKNNSKECVSWSCETCVARNTPTFYGLPWCRWCSGPLGQDPRPGRHTSFFASAGVGLTSWQYGPSSDGGWRPAGAVTQAAAAGAAAAGEAAAESGRPAPTTMATAAAWPRVVRCSRCRIGAHSSCAKRMGTVHVPGASGGAASSSDDDDAGADRPDVFLCRDCLPAFSVPDASSTPGANAVEPRLGTPAALAVRFPVFKPSPAMLAAEAAAGPEGATPHSVAVARISMELGVGGVAPAPGGTVLTQSVATHELGTVSHLF